MLPWRIGRIVSGWGEFHCSVWEWGPLGGTSVGYCGIGRSASGVIAVLGRRVAMGRGAWLIGLVVMLGHSGSSLCMRYLISLISRGSIPCRVADFGLANRRVLTALVLCLARHCG
jgi:hypothetical protein